MKADAVGAVTFLGTAGLYALDEAVTARGDGWDDIGYLVAAPLAVLGALYLGGALIGRSKRNACRVAHEERGVAWH